MSHQSHQALVVEDDPEAADDLVDILKKCGCDAIVVTNRQDAFSRLASTPFCMVLLDLEIGSEPGSIRGRVVNGKAVLEEARRRFPERVGVLAALPIIVISGHATETESAVEAMRAGASDVVQKFGSATEKADRIYAALEATGRTSHAKCMEMATATASQTTQGRMLLTISARRSGRRFVVTLAGREARLRPSSLEVLLQLVKGRLKGQLVFRDEIQAPGGGGLRLVSELRRDMESALDASLPLTENDQHGHYGLDESISVGEVNTAMLETIDERGIPRLAREIRNLLEEKAALDGKD